MFLQFIKIIIVCSFFAFTLTKAPPKLTGDHICHREEKCVLNELKASNLQKSI